jgi:hypothetical protein
VTNNNPPNKYCLLTDDYDKLFKQNIKEFKLNKVGEKKYDVFYPSFGITDKSQCDFIIYGQSIKGWTPQITENADIDKLALCAKNFSNGYFDDHSPLDWVNIYWSASTYNKHIVTKEEKDFYPEMEYSTSRSFFWNVTYKLISKYYNYDYNSWDWSKKIVWSNLYKIAPSERTNPNITECKWQEKISIDLVKLELDELKPKFCIVLTNDNWWEPFRNKIGTSTVSFTRDSNDIIQSVEKYKNTLIIVTSRPYLGGKSDQYVEEILKLLK